MTAEEDDKGRNAPSDPAIRDLVPHKLTIRPMYDLNAIEFEVADQDGRGLLSPFTTRTCHRSCWNRSGLGLGWAALRTRHELFHAVRRPASRSTVGRPQASVISRAPLLARDRGSPPSSCASDCGAAATHMQPAVHAGPVGLDRRSVQPDPRGRWPRHSVFVMAHPTWRASQPEDRAAQSEHAQ